MYIFEVSIERSGKIYKGNAKVEKNTITVNAINFAGSKSASESANNELLAELLLSELIDDYERTHK